MGRVPAGEIEAAVIDQLRAVFRQPEIVAGTWKAVRAHAEDITEVLQIARSNVSTSLKELQTLGLVRREHVLGDRRDHFSATHEPWDMLMAIAEARKQREIDPMIEILRECADAADADPDTPSLARDRLRRMEGFVSNLDGWYDQIKKLPQGTLVKLMGLGTKISRFVGG